MLSDNQISVSVAGIGLYRTTDGGQSFQQITYTDRTDTDRQPLRVFQSKANQEILFVAVLSRFNRSTNNGASWIRIQGTGGRAPGLLRYPTARVGGMNAAIVPSALNEDSVAFHAEATFFTATISVDGETITNKGFVVCHE